MKKSKAIKILEKQIERINEDYYLVQDNWVQETNTYLKIFFGPDSDQASKLDKDTWHEEREE